MLTPILAVAGKARQVFYLLRLLATKRGEVTLGQMSKKDCDEWGALNELRERRTE